MELVRLEPGGTITFSDNVSLSDGDSGGVVLTSGATAGNVVFSGTVDGQTTLSLTSGTGSLSLGGILGGGTELTGLTISGPAITLSNNISIDGNFETSAPVTLGANITIDTNHAGTDGSITFNSTIDGNNTLTLDSGSGAIALQGVVGGGTALSGLSINATDGETGTIEITDIGDGDPAAGVVGTVSIGNANTATLTLDGTRYNTNGATIYEAVAGSASIKITGADVSITTADDNLTFDAGNIELSTDGTTTISTGTGGGDLTIDGTIDGSTGTGNGSEALTITAGTGSTTISGTIGGTVAVTTLSIGGSGNGTISLAGLGDSNTAGATGTTTIGNTSTGTLTLPGTIYKTDNSQTYVAATGQNIDITGDGATFTTTNDNIAFNTAGVDLSFDGEGENVVTTIDTGTGAGTVTFGGAIESGGGDDDVLTITSGTGTVTFTGNIGATQELGGLNVNASSGSGIITFTGDIGDTNAPQSGVIGTSNIGNTATTRIDLDGGLYSFDGTTTFESSGAESVEISVATTIENTANSLSFSGGSIELLNGANLSVTTNGGAITVNGVVGTSSETLSINANHSGGDGSSANETVNITGDIGNADEILSVSVTGRDGITLTGGGSGITIDTANDTNPNISFTGPVTVSGTVTVTSDNATTDGTLGFSSTIDGAGGTDNLTIQSGTGALTLSGTIGVTTALDTLNINTTTGGTAAITVLNIGDTGNAGAITTSIGNANTSNATLSGTYYRTDGDLTITTASGAGAIDFTGAAPTITTSGDAVEFVGGSILLANGSDLTINTNIGNASGAGGNITVAGRIVGTSDEDLTLTTGTAGSTGDVSVHQIGGEISTIAIRGNGKIKLDGDIATSAESGAGEAAPSLTLTGAVELQSSITITTDSGGTDGAVSFSSTVDALNGTTSSLTVDSGTAATTISGAVGATDELSGLTINTTNGDTGAITLTGIGTGTAASGSGAAAVTVGIQVQLH